MRHYLDNTPNALLLDTSVAPLSSRAVKVAEIAAAEASAVDETGSFPSAAIFAAKRLKLLSMLVPVTLGGGGASVSQAANVCFTVGRSCASAGMIIAMHCSALACVARHYHGSQWHKRFLTQIATEELLLASSTTEGKAGGDVRKSEAPLVYADGSITLDRDATVLSYGKHADSLVTTARSGPDSPASSQSLVAFLKHDYTLEETAAWRTLGMRGTCSAGFTLKASAPAAQVFPVPYKTIHSQTMVPVSHLLWCSVWIGVASAALTRAQAFVRVAIRQGDGRMPPGATQFPKALAAISGLQARLRDALANYEQIKYEPSLLEAMDMQTSLNLLKVEVSEGALEIVSLAMRICGLAGYREDGDFSIARHLRDVLSGPIMIHNERILANIASASLMNSQVNSLCDWI